MSKFSVIVPVYNGENYIKKCLDSLTVDTNSDVEIIIINDGSTDNSENIIKSYMDKFANIFLYTIVNHGQGYARNYGLSKANGEYVFFVDSDDYVAENIFKVVDDFLKKQSPDIILYDYVAVSNNGEKLFSKEFDFKNNKNVTDIEYLFSDPGPWNKVYKKEFLDCINFKFPEGIIYEDYAYIPSLIIYEPLIAYIPEELYFYVYSNVSTTRNSEYKKKYEDIFIATEILYNNFLGSRYDEQLCYIIYYHLLYSGALNFYKFEKYDQIDKIADYMKDKFPKWMNNKYIKERSLKERFISYLFYKKRYKLIKFIQNVKKLVKHEQ